MATRNKHLDVEPPPKKVEVSYPAKHLWVMHMPTHEPSDDYSLCLKRVQLINVGPGGIPENKCNDFEKELGCIPDLKPFKDFGWAQRSLLGFSQGSKPHPAGDWNGGYLMYLYLDNVAENEGELRRNHFLEDIADFKDEDGKTKSRLHPSKIRGDAFVFKTVKEEGSPQFSQGNYVDMNKDFINSAKPGGFAYDILEDLLLQPTRRG